MNVCIVCQNVVTDFYSFWLKALLFLCPDYYIYILKCKYCLFSFHSTQGVSAAQTDCFSKFLFQFSKCQGCVVVRLDGQMLVDKHSLNTNARQWQGAMSTMLAT